MFLNNQISTTNHTYATRGDTHQEMTKAVMVKQEFEIEAVEATQSTVLELFSKYQLVVIRGLLAVGDLNTCTSQQAQTLKNLLVTETARSEQNIFKETWSAENGDAAEFSPEEVIERRLPGQPEEEEQWYCSFVSQGSATTLKSALSLLPFESPPFFSGDPNNTDKPKIQHKECAWVFLGRNFTQAGATPQTDPHSTVNTLHGRPEHIDQVSSTGTWHVQISGTKLWCVRPNNEGQWGEAGFPGSPQRVVVRTCPGDMILLNTNSWYHETHIPPTNDATNFVSLSVARDFILTTDGEEQTESTACDMTNITVLSASNNLEENDLVFAESPAYFVPAGTMNYNRGAIDATQCRCSCCGQYIPTLEMDIMIAKEEITVPSIGEAWQLNEGHIAALSKLSQFLERDEHVAVEKLPIQPSNHRVSYCSSQCLAKCGERDSITCGFVVADKSIPFERHAGMYKYWQVALQHRALHCALITANVIVGEALKLNHNFTQEKYEEVITTFSWMPESNTNVVEWYALMAAQSISMEEIQGGKFLYSVSLSPNLSTGKWGFGVDEDTCQVTSVEPNSMAFHYGIQPGDWVAEIGDHQTKVSDPDAPPFGTLMSEINQDLERIRDGRWEGFNKYASSVDFQFVCRSSRDSIVKSSLLKYWRSVQEQLYRHLSNALLASSAIPQQVPKLITFKRFSELLRSVQSNSTYAHVEITPQIVSHIAKLSSEDVDTNSKQLIQLAQVINDLSTLRLEQDVQELHHLNPQNPQDLETLQDVARDLFPFGSARLLYRNIPKLSRDDDDPNCTLSIEDPSYMAVVVAEKCIMSGEVLTYSRLEQDEDEDVSGDENSESNDDTSSSKGRSIESAEETEQSHDAKRPRNE